MFKVSFKENPKFPVKKVQRIERTRETIVTLRGTVNLPVFMQCYIPPKIWDWIESCKNVQAETTMTKMYLTIKGKARRADDDADNPVFGERIAEARAKVNLYRFMSTLCKKLHQYYGNLLAGSYTSIIFGDILNDSICGAWRDYDCLLVKEEGHLRDILAHEPDTTSTPES